MMSIPGLQRPAATWRFLVDLVRGVTEPRADVAWCDEQVAAVAADSAIIRALSHLVDVCRRASESSAVVAACRRSLLPLVPRRLVDRVRAAGVVSAIAAATTLILRNATTERDPLTWALPAAVGAIAVAVAVAAAGRPLARAISYYRS
jgi:hypothetical protein